ncbi:type II secretion system protein GspM [Thiothrix subterranea]|uniref:Type II secretion system protein GspM n=1 Tax=Thiothrix subterranea TaxID=2735563 RepID=A0AA51MNF9_9GAMM|nr:type II secretion system protein GspM [Thiothrix subterranea]MDQ5769552.1 type II secretion system protein GspM [Thiothrix subterranea]WML87135.1 type II secretion system protein GspM [Thiothrix subterranea]
MLNKAFWQQHQVLLAWSLLALLLVIGLFLVVIPSVQKSWELSERIETGYEQLTRFRQMAAATPEFMAEYERVQQNGLDKLFYPAGMTSAQVAKELQKNLATVITRDNGVLLSSEVLDAQQTEAEQANTAYQRVMVKAVFQSEPALLREVLHQAYQARPLMFVESLDVKPMGSEDEKTQVVKAEVQISTYWRGGEVQHEALD